MLLTVFRKTRQREASEMLRAQQAQKVREAEHGPAEHTYDRGEAGPVVNHSQWRTLRSRRLSGDSFVFTTHAEPDPAPSGQDFRAA